MYTIRYTTVKEPDKPHYIKRETVTEAKQVEKALRSMKSVATVALEIDNGGEQAGLFA